MDKHYVDWLQITKIPLNKIGTLCEDHEVTAFAIVNGRTGGLTRTSTSYVCSPDCLWSVLQNSRWKDK